MLDSIIEIREGLLQQRTITRCCGDRFELPQDAGTRHEQALLFAELCSLIPRQTGLLGRPRFGGIGLLRFDGLAFPAACHTPIIAPPVPSARSNPPMLRDVTRLPR